MKYRIKEILCEKGLLAKQAADMIGISPQFLSNIQVGRQEPSLTLLCKISEALNVPLWQIFVSPAEVLPTKDLHAVVDYKGKLYKATSIHELEEIVDKIKSDCQ